MNQTLVQSKVERTRKLSLVDADTLKRIEGDLDAARRLQACMQPQCLPHQPGWDFAAGHLAAGNLGGDFYDFIRVTPTKMAVVVGDAMGRGFAATFLMAQTRAAIRAIATANRSPKKILSAVNGAIAKDAQSGAFVRVFVAVLDFRRLTLTAARAGHVPPVLFRPSTSEKFTLAPAGMVLGVAPQEMFDPAIEECTHKLQSGDRLVICTDGVVDGLKFSADDLASLTEQAGAMASAEFLNLLTGEVEGRSQAGGAQDDMTVVTVRVA